MNSIGTTRGRRFGFGEEIEQGLCTVSCGLRHCIATLERCCRHPHRDRGDEVNGRGGEWAVGNGAVEGRLYYKPAPIRQSTVFLSRTVGAGLLVAGCWQTQTQT